MALFWRLQPVTVRAAAGAQALAELPDGSTAALNGDSRLTYRRGLLGWGNGPLQAERTVRLEGEAFFDVTGGAGRFTVETGNARVAVLGTRFNVRARPVAGGAPDSLVTAVVLAEGRVRLAAAGAPGRSVTLAPGQASRVAGGAPTPPRAARVNAAMAWRRGGFAFQNAPLDEIVAEVERRFGVAVRAPALGRRDSVSLHLPQAESAAAVLRDLCAVQGCRARRAADGFVLDVPGQP